MAFGDILSGIGSVLGGAARSAGNYLGNVSWPQALGGLGTLAGIGSTIYGYNQARDQAAQMRRLARQPLDVNAYYQPMSEAAKTALMRGVKGNLAERGIQPGGYYDALTSESLAKTEDERWRAALQAAGQARGYQLQGTQQGYAPFPMVGDFGGLGKALQYEQTQKANQQALAAQERWRQQQSGMQRQYLDMMGRLGSPSGITGDVYQGFGPSMEQEF